MLEVFLNQLVFFAYFQSVFLLGIYFFKPQRRKQINVFLMILVGVLMLGLSGRVMYLLGFFGGNDKVIIVSEMATLLFGATIYLFTRSSLFERPFSRKDLVHYLPAIIYNVAVVLYFLLPDKDLIAERNAEDRHYLITMLFIGIGLLVNVTYWVLSYMKFMDFKKRLSDEVSYSIQGRFFRNFLIIVGLGMASWTLLYIFELMGFGVLSRVVWQVIWFTIAISILFIAFYTLLEPELFKLKLSDQNRKYANSKLSSKDLEELKKRLEKIMMTKKPYLNRKLLKSELADLLEISNPEMSRVLNETIGMNFFEYVNYYRIKEFIMLAQSENGKQMSFYGLAQEAGFNSKTTFNKSFKQIMGTTPKLYLQQEQE